MKYLVTGGAGFIGSHIVDALNEEGHDVVVLDNLSSGHRENLGGIMNRIEFIEGDVRDAETCLKATDGCDGIFHEAALVSVPASIDRPQENHDINITGTLNVLEAAKKQGVKRVVFASSAAVYGDNPELPKSENMLPEPKSPYSMAKITGEYYLKVYAECYGLETAALRYFNVFGPRQDPSSMYSGVISIFSERITKSLPITIYGDGQQTRDFINVRDVVSANLLVMNAQTVQAVEGVKPKSVLNKPQSGGLRTSTFNESNVGFQVFNVATGKQTSLLQLLDALEKITGRKAGRKFEPVRCGDIRHSVANNDKLRTNGWVPSIALETGLKELYLRCNPERRRQDVQ